MMDESWSLVMLLTAIESAPLLGKSHADSVQSLLIEISVVDRKVKDTVIDVFDKVLRGRQTKKTGGGCNLAKITSSLVFHPFMEF